MQLDAVLVLQPFFASIVKPVIWGVVDDQEDLLWRIFGNPLPQEGVERLSIEDVGELGDELGLVEEHCTIHMGSFPRSAGVHPRLLAYPSQCLVQRAIKPEACLVLEQDYYSAGSSFYLIAGSFSRTHISWASASALAKHLRGRCTENPNSAR